MSDLLKKRAEQICAILTNVAKPTGSLANALARNAELTLIADHAREEGFEEEAKELRSIAAQLEGKKAA